MKLLCASAMIVWLQSSVADDYGYVGEIDLDGDGAMDTIQSGPSSMFGNAGGPMVVTLRETAESAQKQYLIAANSRFAVEHIGVGRAIRLWSYWRVSSREGVLSAFTFTKSELKQENIRVYLAQSKSGISTSIVATIFDAENLFELEYVSPYTVPPHPTENQWGK